MAGVQLARCRVFDDGHPLFDQRTTDRAEPAAAARSHDAVDEWPGNAGGDAQLEAVVIEDEDAGAGTLRVLFDELRDAGEDQLDLGPTRDELEDLALIALQRLGLPALGD